MWLLIFRDFNLIERNAWSIEKILHKIVKGGSDLERLDEENHEEECKSVIGENVEDGEEE